MRVVVHGGAGHTGEVQDGVETAADVGWKLLVEGADAVSAAVATVVVLEDDSRFNAGTGACLRADGSVQTDAAVACNDGRLGTVAVLEDIANPVQVARLVMGEDFDALAGKGALDYARSRGITPATVIGSEKPWAGDTVGAVVQDSSGAIAVASSTGGVRGRLAGRVGDTPHWGGGLWTDTGVGIAATGIGEAISRRLLCFRVARMMADGLSVQKALEWGIALYPPDIIIGLIALSDTEGAGVSNSSMPWALRQD